MSAVEKFWEAVKVHFGVTQGWNELHPELQMQMIHSINGMIHVMNVCNQNQQGG